MKMNPTNNTSIIDTDDFSKAVRLSFTRLMPHYQMRNPVMFLWSMSVDYHQRYFFLELQHLIRDWLGSLV